MTFRYALLFPVAAAMLVARPAMCQTPLKITEMAVTTKIVRGNPIDSVHRISATSVKALYCFTRLVNPSPDEATIKHVWYKDGEKTGEYDLPVKAGKWRTYSKKAIDRDSAGDWKVEAVDAEGKIVRTVKFRIN